ncbi:MAG: hypothetical protein U9P68_12645 [Pseudomonadota bacterium]|nr:hypothetical protein [Pseudomonadota bacterium]
MSFQEKSNAAMLVITAAVYGWYFVTSAGSVFGGGLPPEAALAATNVKMLLTVLIIVAVSIVAHILIAIMAPSQANEAADERDKLIEMRGDQRGGFVLALFALLAMGLAMLGKPPYLFANTILAGLVAGELVKGVSKLIDYRRGV